MMNETGLETKKDCMDFAGYCDQVGILGCHTEEPQAFSCHPEGCFLPEGSGVDPEDPQSDPS